MSKRIYKVTDTALNVARLVRASTPAQAVGHVTRVRFAVKVASQDEIVDALNDDVTVETAGEEPPAPPADDQESAPSSGDQQPQSEVPPQAAAA
jgi:hypothetical protein